MSMTEEMMKEMNLLMGTRLKLIKIKNLLKPSTSTSSSYNETNIPTPSSEAQQNIELDVIDFFKKKKSYPPDRNLEDLFLKNDKTHCIIEKLKQNQEISHNELCMFTDIVVNDLMDVTGEE